MIYLWTTKSCFCKELPSPSPRFLSMLDSSPSLVIGAGLYCVTTRKGGLPILYLITLAAEIKADIRT